MNIDIRQAREDARERAAQLFTWCTVVAMHQEEKIGATRLEKACNEMQGFQERYGNSIFMGTYKTATEAMRRDLNGICDFEVRLPRLRAPRNRREEQLYLAENDGAEISWLVMAATVHLTFNFGKERLARLKNEALSNYRQYIGMANEDGEDYAMDYLKRCVEQALHEELEVLDGTREKTEYDGRSSRFERYENARLASETAAIMAKSRGIKRVPCAVLSAAELDRRLKAI